MSIYSFSTFGFDGSIINIEVDLRRGIPATDIIGIADNSVKELRERMLSAIRNSGFEYPSERVLISLSPADLRKEGACFDLPVALAVLAEKDEKQTDTGVLVMGELELSGKASPCRGVYAALETAVENGIKYAIVPNGCDTAIPKGIHVEYVDNLREAYDALVRIDEAESLGTGFEESATEEAKEMKVEFDDIPEDNLDTIEGHDELKYAMAVAVAGGHHILVYGAPGCGKTLLLQHMPELMPKLSFEESQSTTRIYSLAGLLSPKESYKTIRPFRMPHQTASIEGMCGGGINCRPGEISLAHNGVLFLDEAAEFRTSVLQMLRVPMESKHITLARAGRSTVYPANFQLALAMNPCPCGNYGHPERVCLCSAKAVELYWRKVSGPLLDRIPIRFNCNEKGYKFPENFTLAILRDCIATARKRQYERQGKLNQELSQEEAAKIKLDPNAKYLLELRHGISNSRNIYNILILARTLEDMNTGYDVIPSTVMERAIELYGHI